MIVEVKEFFYKGIFLQHVADKGWKCTLGDREYLFPHCQAAECAIDEIFGDIQPIIRKNGGEKLPKAKRW